MQTKRQERKGRVLAMRWAVEPALSLVGMSFLWLHLRYQGFLLTLFPEGTTISLFGRALPAHSVFVVALCATALVALARWRDVLDALCRHPALVPLMAILASAAATCGQLGVLGGDAGRLIVVLALAPGFVVCFLAWASYLAVGFDVRKLVVLLLAYPCSVAAMYAPFALRGAPSAALSSFMTAGAGICWYVLTLLLARVGAGRGVRAKTPASGGQTDGTEGGAAVGKTEASGRRSSSYPAISWLDFIDPLVGATAVFILAGAGIRGVIDRGISPSPSERMAIILAMSALAVVIVLVARAVLNRTAGTGERGTASRGRQRRERRGDDRSAQRGCDEPVATPAGDRWFRETALVCWMILAFIWFVGTLMYLCGVLPVTGAYLATTSCSLMMAFYYALLAEMCLRRSVNYVPIFLTYGVLFWGVCFFVSYVAVPAVMDVPAMALPATGPGGMLVFLLTLLVVAFGVVALALSMLAGDEARASRRNSGEWDARGALAADDKSHGAALVGWFGLTAREAQVVSLYASGYSLGRVAETLCISKTTAQGYVKSAYRKLGVHNKNALVDAVVSRVG